MNICYTVVLYTDMCRLSSYIKINHIFLLGLAKIESAKRKCLSCIDIPEIFSTIVQKEKHMQIRSCLLSIGNLLKWLGWGYTLNEELAP